MPQRAAPFPLPLDTPLRTLWPAQATPVSPSHLPALLAVGQVTVPGEAAGREALPWVRMLWSLQHAAGEKLKIN